MNIEKIWIFRSILLTMLYCISVMQWSRTRYSCIRVKRCYYYTSRFITVYYVIFFLIHNSMNQLVVERCKILILSSYSIENFPCVVLVSYRWRWNEWSLWIQIYILTHSSLIPPTSIFCQFNASNRFTPKNV